MFSRSVVQATFKERIHISGIMFNQIIPLVKNKIFTKIYFAHTVMYILKDVYNNTQDQTPLNTPCEDTTSWHALHHDALLTKHITFYEKVLFGNDFLLPH